MAQTTQKKLIEQIKTLKEIKPRKEWAILLKSQILASSTKIPVRIEKNRAELIAPVRPEKTIGIMDILSFVFSPRKLAYDLAVILFLIVGIFGFAQRTVPGDLLFPVKKIAEQSQAALTGQPGLIVTLNSRINDLAQVAKEGRTNNIPSAIDEIKTNASALVKNIKSNPVNDLETMKEIAISLKTLASVPGTDLSANQDVKNLNQIVVENLIADLEKTTLTDEQGRALLEAKELYNQEKYIDALEKILLIK